MAAVQRSNSTMKEPILPRTSSTLKGSLQQQLPVKSSTSTSLKLDAVMGVNKFSSAIRNRNIVIGVLSTFLLLTIVSWPWHGSLGPSFAAYQRDDDSPLQGVSRVGEGIRSDPFQTKWANAARVLPYHRQHSVSKQLGSSKFLVTPEPLVVPYHKGPVLTGNKQGVLKVYLIYYGLFSLSQRATLGEFLASFAGKAVKGTPTVAGWWAITKGFKDAEKVSVAPTVIAGDVYDYVTYIKGKTLKVSDVEALVVDAITAGQLPLDTSGLYVVLTAANVAVQGFCSQECGTHLYTTPVKATHNHVLPYAWVGNAVKQCPGFCDWPYAQAAPGTGPNTPALKPPNSDLGIDGMIITLASLIAGAATDPYGNGYFQGDADDPLEIAGVCGGIYGEGAYPGYPGNLLTNKKGASFNAQGVKGRQFLLPWIYNPATQQCAGQV
jgi:hypothetical protein